ncbi:hypothetical protein [Burkholderia pseudomultivorans]|uniref:hypothetical protein n=1 Tax=Burkholderia pseudomultivorans TaxID=1207504 RepID=UPI00188F6AD5|nr:hypothetical protein [Burkholderia pseudomultivorans]MBF5010880.1 hypothetical protein [Burkholderia pseudomultivorans]
MEKRASLPKQDYPLSGAREQSTIFFAGRKKNLWIEVSARTAPTRPDPIAVYRKYLSVLTARQCRQFNADAFKTVKDR